MIPAFKFRIKITTFLLLLFALIRLASSTCQIFLKEANTPIFPFFKEIPENYNAKGDFEADFDKHLIEYKSHPNNFFEFQRYCQNYDDDNFGTYGFAAVEILDTSTEYKPIILQYFKFNDSSFNNGTLIVGTANGKNMNDGIEIQKLKYETYVIDNKYKTKKYGISKRYAFLLFEYTDKTKWIDHHFAYNEKYVSLDKIEKLAEASIDAFILSEEYGIPWIKRLYAKLNIPVFDFQASINGGWIRCCNNWFISPKTATAGIENSCCSPDLKALQKKAIQYTFKESGACKVPGCLLTEGQHVNITAENKEHAVATVIKMKEKTAKVRYYQNSIEYHTDLPYYLIFDANPFLTTLNCTPVLPEIIHIDELNKTDDLFPKYKNTKREIIFCYLNESLNEKVCGKFYIGQNITVADGNQKESTARITSVFTNSDTVFAETPNGNTLTYNFTVLKEYNPQNFVPQACLEQIFTFIPTKTLNVGSFNRSIAMSKLLQNEKSINYTTAENTLKTGTIVRLMQTFIKLKDDETGAVIRHPYTKIIPENPSVFGDLESDRALELCYTEENGGRKFCAMLKLGQMLDYFKESQSYNGKISKIHGDLGVVLMTTDATLENIPTTAEEIHFTNYELFKEVKVPTEGDASLFKCKSGKHFDKPHLHQRKKSVCN